MALAAGVAVSLTLGAAAFAQDTQPKTEAAPPAATAPADAAKVADPVKSTDAAKPVDLVKPADPAKPAEAATPAASAEAAAAAQVASPAKAAPAPGKGRIVFFRPTRLTGAFYTYHVVEVGADGVPPKDAPHLADLSNGAAVAIDVEPGVHAYNITGPMAINKAEDRLRMEVEPGETYYVEQAVRIGLFTGGFRLNPADEARFTQSNTKLKTAEVKAAN